MSLLLFVWIAACVGRAQRNVNCEWPQETAISLHCSSGMSQYSWKW